MRTVSFASRASIFFQHKTQLTQDGPDEFLNGKKLPKIPLSFTRDRLNRASF